MIRDKKKIFTYFGIGGLILFLILNFILINSVTAPTVEEAPNRHVVYWTAVILSNIVYNVLAMYVGAKFVRDDNPLGKFPKIVITYFTVISIYMLGIISYTKSFSYQDILDLLFPISRNVYPFAFAMLICYIFASPFIKQIRNWSGKQRKAIFSFLVWFVVVVPLLFDKNIWLISSGTNIIWLSMLFVLGMVWKKHTIKSGIIKDSIVLVVLVIAIFVTVKFLPLTQDPTNLQGKIFSTYSLLSFLLTIVIFDFYYNLKRTDTFEKGSWLIFNAYFLIHTPIFVDLIKNNFTITNDISFVKWSILIAEVVAISYLIVLIVTVILYFIMKLSFFKHIIRSYSIEDSSDLTGLYDVCKRLIVENRRLIIVSAITYIITIIQFIAVRATAEPVNSDLIRDVIINQGSKVFLTFLIYIAIFYVLYALINKYIYSVFIIIVASTLVTVAEYLKITMRREPILSTDLSLISTLPEVFKMLNQSILYITLGSIVVLFILTLIISIRLEPKMKYKENVFKHRLKIFLCAMLFLTITLWKNDLNSIRTMILNSVGYQNIFWDTTEGAKINGPVLQFANDFVEKKMLKPDGYTEKNIRKIEKKYDKIAAEINQKRSNSLKNQTVVFILSESFSDPGRIPGLRIDHNPIPFITSLKQQTPSGLMVSSGYGGGTANLEWQALSGMAYGNLVANIGMPYYQIAPGQKLAPNISDLFTNKIAIHPYVANFYNRISVFEKYGFQHFYYEGSKDKLTYTDKIDANPYISDESAYKEVVQQIINLKGSAFIQLSTMQNHQPYNIDEYTQNDFKLIGSAINESNKSSLEGYIEGISKTDEATKNFIDQINQINKPITVVWYGDHLPGVYPTLDAQKDALTMHETDYFVYSNRSAEKLKNNSIAGPYEFPAFALEAGNNKVTPYYALLTKVANELPVISTNITGKDIGADTVFINEDNEFITEKDLTPSQKELLHEYRLIQYDLLVGKQYSGKWAQQKLK